MTETNRIEFKRCLTKELDIEKEVVAFLNYREGGIIYIGIDDNGKIHGSFVLKNRPSFLEQAKLLGIELPSYE